MVRHTLFLRFNPDSQQAELDRLRAAFFAFEHTIPGIKSIEWGENCSPEGKNQGFSHCVSITFENIASRDTYLDHPEHLALQPIIQPVLMDIIVLDYEPGES